MDFRSLCFIIISIFCSCETAKEKSGPTDNASLVVNREVTSLQNLLDSNKLKGSILVYDLSANTFISNNFEWAKTARLPASTFKIPNSIIALETGVVASDSALFKWNGEKRWLKAWEQDLIFTEAFRLSCVPCYQEVARNIGADRMRLYLDTLQFGLMEFDTTTINNFWLTGNSKISQFEQIGFLKQLYHSQLPISKRTENIVKNMMVIEENSKYTLSGKTGWTMDGNYNNGWFVGYLEKDNSVYFFATNVEPTETFDMKNFAASRKEVSLEAMELLF